MEARNMVFKKREAEGIFGLGNCDNAGISSEGVTVDIGDFATRKDEEQIFELSPENEVISYRRAVFQDIEAMAALDALCFGRAWSAASYEAELGGDKVITYVLAENEAGNVVGLAGIAYIAGEAEINRVAVEPLYRARGIAGHMVEMLIEDAENRHISNITLEVREANRSAIGLYKMQGFKVEGRRKGYYAETGENALIMWRRREDDRA